MPLVIKAKCNAVGLFHGSLAEDGTMFVCMRFSSNQIVVALYYFQFLVAEFVFSL